MSKSHLFNPYQAFLQVVNHNVHKFYVQQLVTAWHIFKPVEYKEQRTEASLILGHFYRHLFSIVTGLICLTCNLL